MVHTATQHDAPTCSRLRSIPGVGTSLALVLLSARHDRHRWPRRQECVSACRLGQGARAAAGTRSGPSGTKSGQAPRTGAWSAAAVLCLRHKPAGQPALAR